ncbi:MAG: hypothetical protein ACP5G7_07935 [Anaerolineae bacterium]
MKRIMKGLVAVALLAALLAMGSASMAASVDPVYHEGNVKCCDTADPSLSLGYCAAPEFKIQAPYGGTHTFPDGVNTITITVTRWEDGQAVEFSWTSTLPLDAVIVKAGSGANVYSYDPELSSDSGLQSPINPKNDKNFGISHIEFCYDYELLLAKTANTSYTRTYAWTIDKSVTPDEWHLFNGDSGTSRWTVSVDKTGYADSGWAVTGTITIDNPASSPATIVSVADAISGVGAATVDCGVTMPYELAAGGTLVCSYDATLPDATDRTNTATVTTSGDVGGGDATADVVFGAPATEVNASVMVTDTNGMAWGPVSDDASWSYDETFQCGCDAGEHSNTATIVETGQSDDASVTVNCYELTVSKDANTSLSRTWEWDIEKTVSPDGWDLFRGDSGTSLYTVSVDKTGVYTDSGWAVTGTITINNPAPITATINVVTDVISDVGAATVDCSVSFPYELAADDTLACSYSRELPNADGRLNTATATLQNYDYDYQMNATADGTAHFCDTADVSFEDPVVTEVNAEINVTDSNGESWGPVSDDTTWTYERKFTCDDDAGSHDNTATIDETGQSDEASVSVACYAIEVTKTADTSFNRYWDWTIEKVGDQDALTLSIGQQFLVNYDVTVTPSYADKDWAVAGEISVHNPAPMAATINSLADLVSPDIAPDVSCEVTFPYELAADVTLACTYGADLPNAAERDNTATATLQNVERDYNDVVTETLTTVFSGEANVIFGDAPDDEFDKCIDVTDTLMGTLGKEVCADESTAKFTFSYSKWIGPYWECGYPDPVENCASFVSKDTPLTGQDCHSVDIEVPCVGCTLTPGYWKTHSMYGPAPYDDTWALIGENTLFFLSGQSYYEVLWTEPSGGNAYYILAHAYIAAELNFLNGADPTAAEDAFDEVTALFAEYTPDEVAAMKGKTGREMRMEFIELAMTLDDYNNGLIGPGHCSE